MNDNVTRIRFDPANPLNWEEELNTTALRVTLMTGKVIELTLDEALALEALLRPFTEAAKAKIGAYRCAEDVDRQFMTHEEP